MAREVELLVGREDGLFSLKSTDGGHTWGPTEVLIPAVEIHAAQGTAGGTVYVGTRGHGLFRREAGLRKWEPIETPPAAQRVRSLCTTEHRLIVGTEAGSGPGAAPVGIFEWSEKAGWQPLGDLTTCSGSREWFYPAPSEEVHLRWVSVDPQNPERIYTAIQVGGIGISPDNGETWSDRRDLDSLDVHMVVPHPTDAGVVYAGAGGRSSGFYRSRDAGDTWEVLAPDCGPFVVQFALHPTHPSRIYLGTARGHVRDWATPGGGGAHGEAFRSDDGGETWRKLAHGLPEFMESRINVVFVDPEEPDSVYFGGGLPSGAAVPGIAADAGVYQSLDGGESWRQIMTLDKGEPLTLWTAWS